MILRRDVYRVEESVKFGTTNLFGVEINLAWVPRDLMIRGGRHVISILDNLHQHEIEVAK